MRWSRLRREIRFLRCYALGVTVLGGALFLGGAMHGVRSVGFDRIVAHRIDIIDREGKLAMILTDHDDFPEPVMNGKTGHRTRGTDIEETPRLKRGRRASYAFASHAATASTSSR